MALNQLFLTKSGSDGWVEDSSAIISTNAGHFGIGTASPDESLEITGRFHIGQAAAPSVTTDKIYNLGGNLYWNGWGVVTANSIMGAATSYAAGLTPIGNAEHSGYFLRADGTWQDPMTPETGSPISFETNGEERMTIDDEGRIGFGTSNPDYFVHITGDTYIGGDLIVTGTTTTIDSVTLTVDDKNIELGSVDSPTDTTANGGGITLRGTTNKTINWDNSTFGEGTWISSEHFAVEDGKDLIADQIRARDNEGLLLTNDGGNGIFISDSGNVGIGTTSPSAPLEISTTSDEAVRINQGAGALWNYLSFYHDDQFKGYVGTVGSHDSDLDGGLTLTALDGENLYFRTAVGSGGESGNLTDNRITIKNSNGYVGIGTEHPSSCLEVKNTHASMLGLFRAMDIRNSANGSAARIEGGALNNTTKETGAAIGLGLFDTSSDGSATRGYMSFETKGAGGLEEKMRIASDGTVGIGTTNPISQLTVSGQQEIFSLHYGDEKKLRTYCLADGMVWAIGDNTEGGDEDIRFDTRVGYPSYIKLGAGKFGIGTPSPDYQLTSSGNVHFGINQHAHLYVTQASTSFGDTFNTDVALNFGTDSALHIGGAPPPTNSPVVGMTISGVDDKYRVGIGTKTPMRKLHIQTDPVIALTDDTGGEGTLPNTRGIVNNLELLNFGKYSEDFSDFVSQLAIGIDGNVGIGLGLVDTIGGEALRIHKSGAADENVRLMGFSAPGNPSYSDGQQLVGRLMAKTNGSNFTDSRISFDMASTDGTTYEPALTLEAGGNVGIGTDSPSDSLHIKGGMKVENDGASPLIQFADTSGVSRWAGLVDGTSNFVIYGTGGWTEEFIIDGDGNVGIGTNSPASQLHLYDTQSNILKVESTSNDAVLRLDTSASQWDIDNDGNGSDTVPAGDLHIRKDSGVTKVMTFSNALGFVGVGQHRPTSCLEVKNTHAHQLGLFRALDIRNSPNGAASKIEGGALNNTTKETGAAIGFALYDTSSNGSATRGYMYCETKGSDGLVERMRIDQHGRMGINHKNPAHALDVSGFICANSPNPGIRFMESDTTDSNWDIQNSAGDLLFGTVADDFGSAVEKMRITLDGKVGIGINQGANATDTPAANLDISSQGAVASNMIWAKADGVPGAAGYTGAWTTYGVKYHSQGRPDYSYSVGMDSTEAGTPKFRIGYSFGYADRPGANPLFTIESNGDIHFSGDLYQNGVLYGGSSSQSVETSDDVQFQSLGVNIAPSGTAGSIIATNDIVAYVSSDERLKDNISLLSNPIEKVCQIKGVEFDWNEESYVHLDGHDIGVLAQDVEKVLPEVVATRDDGYKAVRYEKMVPLLIEAIKDQQEQIKDLKSRLDEAGL